MYKTTWDGTEAVMVALGKSLLTKGTIGDAVAKVRAVLSSSKCDWMDARSVGDVAFSARDVIRNCMPYVKDKSEKGRVRLLHRIVSQTDTVMKAFNRAYRALWKATKDEMLRTGMRNNRERYDPVVFYVVSSHQKPQPAHKDLQGKVLVDRFWRSSLVKAGKDDLVGEVARYIKRNKIGTVQWAVGAPHYLVTRPNCKHFLIPMFTSDVLEASKETLKERSKRGVVGVRRPITDAQRAQAYASLRSVILSKLEKTGF